MRQEHQQLEFKESWRDEWLKSIAAFANSSGGCLIIGLNDKGVPVGVAGSKKLLEDITNKAQNILGLLVSTKLEKENGLDLIYVEVPASTYYAVAYQGKYYQRSGATTQEVKGANLTAFLLKRTGQTYDSLPIQADVVLLPSALDHFRRLGTLVKGDNRYAIPEQDLLDKLELLTLSSELTTAAVIAFHDCPRRVIPGAFVQIGFFDKDPRPSFENEVTAGALQQVEEVLDLVMTKYLITPMSWFGIQRTEKIPVPQDALREAIVNAIIHRDYSIPSPIQIRSGRGYLTINSPGKLPDDIKIEDLKGSHPSRRRNPKLAEVFKQAGYVEAWGTGFDTIRKACKAHGNVDFLYNESDAGFEVKFTFVYEAHIDFVDTLPGIGETVKTSQTPSEQVTLTSKENALTSKETADNTTEEEVTSKENAGTSKENALTTRESDLTTGESGLTTREKKLTTRESGLTTREKPLTTGESGLTTREKKLTTRESGLTTREKPLTTGESGLTTREKKLTTGESGLTTREKPLTIRETSRSRNLEMTTEVLKQLSQDPSLTAKRLATILNITIDGVYYHLKLLKAQGKITQEGSTKKPYWKVQS